MEVGLLKVERRSATGTRAAEALRRHGRVPAVMYGHGGDCVPLSVDEEVLAAALHSGARVVTLELDGAEQQALIKEIQYDTFGQELLHVDFARVALDERIVLEVSIEVHGDAKGALQGGVLEQPLHAVEIECLAASVPDNIRVEVAEMDIGDSIHVKDLALPSGVKTLANLDEVVVIIHPPRKAEEVEVAIPEEAPAEPEVISGKPEEKPEEEAGAEESS